MDNAKKTTVPEMTSGTPITLREYADQYDVCPATVEQWFKHGKEITTIDLDSPEPRRAPISITPLR